MTLIFIDDPFLNIDTDPLITVNVIYTQIHDIHNTFNISTDGCNECIHVNKRTTTMIVFNHYSD